MNDIYDATTDFKFENLSMTSPASITGGAHFSKYLMNRNPLYIQTPKCSTKIGIVKSGKKNHMDLVFTNVNEEFIQWIETLETTTRKLIYANRAKWFDMDLDEDDIESYFTPTVKLFKSGKQYLVRVNINQRINGTPAVKIYDESEIDVAPETIDDKSTLITIIEVQGVKCSAKSFQIELVLKQIMVIKPVEIFEKCIIKTRSSNNINTNTNVVLTNTSTAYEDTLEEDISDSPIQINTKVADSPIQKVETLEAPSEQNILMEISETEPTNIVSNNDILEVDLDDTNIKEEDTIFLKDKTEVYYEMYRNARQKAKLAKSLALSSFMEARRIKNMYMLDDLDDSDDEEDLEDLENEGLNEDEIEDN
jgi:hypothetical protein